MLKTCRGRQVSPATRIEKTAYAGGMHITCPDDPYKGELRLRTVSTTRNIDIMSAPHPRGRPRSPEHISIVWESSSDAGDQEALLQALEMLLPSFSGPELGELDESEPTANKGRD